MQASVLNSPDGNFSEPSPGLSEECKKKRSSFLDAKSCIKEMYFIDSAMYGEKPNLQDSIELFFSHTVPHMDINPDNEETVLEIGSGIGRVTRTRIVPLFPKLKELHGFDLLPNMVEYAKAHNPHPAIEYSVASIEDWATIKKWEGHATKMFSVHCFNWLKDQTLAFEHVHKLLKSGGEAAFIFCLHTPYFQAVVDIAKDPKWKRYLENVPNCVPESHYRKYEAPHYRNILERIGFEVVFIESSLVNDSYQTDKEFRNFFASICVLVSHVPSELREEFKDDLFQYNLRLNGRNEKGQPIHRATMLQLVVKKP